MRSGYMGPDRGSSLAFRKDRLPVALLETLAARSGISLTAGSRAADTSDVNGLRWLVSILSIMALVGCGTRSEASRSAPASARSAEGARHTLLAFFSAVRDGDYERACSLYTPAVRVLVDRSFGGCLKNVAGLHTLAENERAEGMTDVLSRTVQRVQAATFLLSGNTATTMDLGRPGTVTTLVYRDGRWEIDRPAT